MKSELTAVNSLLIARDVAPVQQVVAGHPLVSSAVSILNEQKELLQDRGWWFNRDYDVQLPRDAENKVKIPNGVLRVDGLMSYSVLGGYLYDNTEHSIVFSDDDPELVDLIWDRDWADLPPTMYAYIIAEARSDFILPLESLQRNRKAELAVQRAKAAVLQAELDNRDIGTQILNPLMLKLMSKVRSRF